MRPLPGRDHGAADHVLATRVRALDAALHKMRPHPSNSSCIQPVAIRTARLVCQQFVLTDEMRPSMHNKNKVAFLTADHLEEQADARTSEAKQLPEGEARQNALRNAAQLRMYASMKRVLTPQTARSKYQTRIEKVAQCRILTPRLPRS
jgi:hypothetical protein